MKQLRKLKMILAFTLVLAMVSPVVLPVGNVAVAEAKTKTIKLSDKKATIRVGQSITLNVTGTTSKVTWTSSKKKIATVTKDGTVTGLKSGTATITAAVKNKKYTCKVTVKKAATNSYTEKTTYKSIAAEAEGVNYVLPEDWTYETNKAASGIIINYSKSVDTTKSAEINSVLIQVADNSGANKMDYATLKAYIEATIKTQTDSLKAAGYTDVTYTVTDFTYDNGTAIMTDYTFTLNGVKTILKVYDILVGEKLIEITAIDMNDGTTPAPAAVAQDMLNSIQVVED